MISARVGSDGFIIWSIPYARACALVPQGLIPTCCEGRGWLALAAVELHQLRVFGCPVPRSHALAAWLVVVEIAGGRRRANYFHTLYSDAPVLAAALRLAGAARTVRTGRVRIRRDERTLAIEVGQEVQAAIDLGSSVPAAHQARLQSLFATNRSGVGRGHGGCFESRVTKDQWRMDPHAASIMVAPFLHDLDARLAFAFDASDVTASWAPPRRLEREFGTR